MMKRLKTIACGLAALLAQPALALEPSAPDAAAKAEVLATVDRFMAAISSNDAEVLEELYLP